MRIKVFRIKIGQITGSSKKQIKRSIIDTTILKYKRVDRHLLCVSLLSFGSVDSTMNAVHYGFTAQNGLPRSYHSQSRLKHHGRNGGEEENGGSLEGGGRAAAVAVVGGA